MILVIAGDHNQAYHYINRKLEERIRNGEVVSKVDDYKYVHSADSIRGLTAKSGVFIGTWKDRRDIRDIVQALIIQSEGENQTLKKIWKELNE